MVGDQKVCEKFGNYCRLQAKQNPVLSQVATCIADWHARMNVGRVRDHLHFGKKKKKKQKNK